MKKNYKTFIKGYKIYFKAVEKNTVKPEKNIKF